MAKRKSSRPYKDSELNHAMREKLLVTVFMIALALIALAVYLTYINYKDGERYSKYVLDNQQYDSSSLPFKRGDITDRNGTVLAYSSKVYNLILDPKVVLSSEKYKDPTLSALAEYFALSRSDLEGLLASKPDSHYEKLLKGLTQDQISEFNKMLEESEEAIYIRGIWFEEEYVRNYPFDTLACDVVGFASSASVGELGLENYYNEELTGVNGVSYGYVDSDLNLEKTVKPAVDGYNLVTTIDYSVQAVIEEDIRAFNEEFGSDNTAVIVMNPNNGEIIAEASYPVFDLNNPRDMTSIYTVEELNAMDDETMLNSLYTLWNNYCVSSIFEPGSTMKPFTVGAALEEGLVHDGDTYMCDGSEKVLDMTIKCHNIYGHGELTLEQTIMQSCNDALMQIGMKLGADLLAKYQDIFGFGYRTYVDLPGEDAGLTYEASKMDATDVATNSFGQNIEVNMHQLVAGFCSLVNGGYYYQPHLVKRIETSTGEVVKTIRPTLIRQTITEETSALLRKYMQSTVATGTGKRVAVEGYDIGGKTGTAETWALDEDGKNLGYRSITDYVISFIGFAPCDDPQFVIYVVIDNPQVDAVGTAIPVCELSHTIMEDILPLMNVYPDYTDPNATTEEGTTTEATTDATTEATTEATTKATTEETTTAKETETKNNN
ncbi:MAG: peptidoglycan glycosyltransferase [Lachnospiraceae bacterium]|nr:peptidoglycan glycosyltransferase [Lachnospiraceae bacterium]